MSLQPIHLGDPNQPVEALNPGIRETVRWLRRLGFTTIDSGDGNTHEFECDQLDPYVIMSVEPHALLPMADLLKSNIDALGIHVWNLSGIPGQVEIQATYDPGDGTAIIMLNGLDDATLLPALAGNVTP